MKRIISKEADVYIREHFATESYQSLAEKFGVTERQMRGHINNMGWTKRRTVDAHYFDEIDTPEKAYWLGFIYADGYICGSLEQGDARGAELGMELQTQDRYARELLDWVYHGCGDHKLLRKYNIYKSFYGLAA